MEIIKALITIAAPVIMALIGLLIILLIQDHNKYK